jgi:hypothetical protein
MPTEPTTQTTQTPNPLDDLVDEFCYELAIILRRILDLEDPTGEDEDDDSSG